MLKTNDILKTENIIKVMPDDTLSHALAKLTTSHDAAFVFSEDNKFLGLINPYYCLIKSSYPGNAKVGHCLFHPPRLKINYPINKVIELMIQSKIHYLPVFDDKDRFMGIVSARRVLLKLQNDLKYKVEIETILSRRKRPVITIYEDDTIPIAVNLFKQYRVSKLVIINKDLKLKGILSYYDLIRFLISPKERSQPGEREGNKINFYNHWVKNFGKTYVLTLSKKDRMLSALHLVLEKKIGSVVIVDEERHPLGIITTKDLLNLFIQPNIGIRFEILSKNLSKQSKQIVGNFFHNVSGFAKKIPDVSKFSIFVKKEKGEGVFKVLLSLLSKKGDKKVIKKEGNNLLNLLQEVKNGLKRIKASR